MPLPYDIIVMGASAGGIPALQLILGMLPAELPAAVIVVLHRSEAPLYSDNGNDALPHVLTSRAKIRAELAFDGQPITPGRVYVAPRGGHLLIERGTLRIEASPRESRAGARPSINVLFRSAARAYGRRVVGVLLTGLLDDGTAGLWQIRNRGGVTIVQDPAEAPYPAMPQNALDAMPVDYSLPTTGIAERLIELARRYPAEQLSEQPAGILIVEDERLVALNLESRLIEQGYEVVGSVSSAEAALEASLLMKPDLVLMDIRLSGKMNGTEAARILWERDQVPTIFLTAYADQEVLDGAKLANAYGYLVKPFRPAQVHAAIQIALDRYHREMRAI